MRGAREFWRPMREEERRERGRKRCFREYHMPAQRYVSEAPLSLAVVLFLLFSRSTPSKFCRSALILRVRVAAVQALTLPAPVGAARLAPQLTVEIELVLSQLILSTREVGSGLVINRAQVSLVFEG